MDGDGQISREDLLATLDMLCDFPAALQDKKALVRGLQRGGVFRLVPCARGGADRAGQVLEDVVRRTMLEASSDSQRRFLTYADFSKVSWGGTLTLHLCL